MSEIKWIKITTDIFDDEKIRLIDALPDHDAILVIWFKILALAGKHNRNGLLMMSDKVHYTDEMLATIFQRPLNTVRMALGVFEQFGMIEIIDGVITLPNWEKHQNIDGMERIKKLTQEKALRMKLLPTYTTSAGLYLWPMQHLIILTAVNSLSTKTRQTAQANYLKANIQLRLLRHTRKVEIHL